MRSIPRATRATWRLFAIYLAPRPMERRSPSDTLTELPNRSLFQARVDEAQASGSAW